MIRAFRPRLWHFSALVLISAPAIALARAMPEAGGLAAAFGLLFLLIGLAACLGMVSVAARLGGIASDWPIERGRARGGRGENALVVLGVLAYFVIAPGVACLGLAAIIASFVLTNH